MVIVSAMLITVHNRFSYIHPPSVHSNKRFDTYLYVYVELLNFQVSSGNTVNYAAGLNIMFFKTNNLIIMQIFYLHKPRCIIDNSFCLTKPKLPSGIYFRIFPLVRFLLALPCQVSFEYVTCATGEHSVVWHKWRMPGRLITMPTTTKIIDIWLKYIMSTFICVNNWLLILSFKLYIDWHILYYKQF